LNRWPNSKTMSLLDHRLERPSILVLVGGRTPVIKV
jgi:hypothetical protein